jgi:hypothetical protein
MRGGRYGGERGGPGAVGNGSGGRHRPPASGRGRRRYRVTLEGSGMWVTLAGARQRGGRADTCDPASSGRGRVKRGAERALAHTEKTRSGPGPDE